MNEKKKRRQRMKYIFRKRIYGTNYRPRLSVFRSNREISVQVINDMKGETLATVTTMGKKIQGTKSEKARIVGKQIGKHILDLGIKEVVFDRNGYLYHGRIKALAEAAREIGLKF
ncbi:50S ribosomal protein L18 [Candidatus Uzinura diaspidicola str. ASNER]|uniref:Large ribosomal subunit protein uL18 n=1 Tax=Candidatus Uzinura diaspidicola str. ASNER TaxID=1133592 RepID=L7VJN4_9FLAO|nr:50S ribosomal protein L18 [Candidatus Uzinura diaspidicola str. ASNER]